MDATRSELLPGVWLTYLKCEKFKTACLSVSLLTQLRRETAAMNALIPAVLSRGTVRYDDMEKLSGRMDELYGTSVDPIVRRIGEIQCVGFFASFPEGAFLPGGKSLLGEVSELTAELLLSPVTRGGLLLPQYVDSEKEKQIDLIRSRINDKRGYSVQRCIEEMCCYEDFAVSRFGTVETCEAIHYKKLTRHYRELLRTSPVEIFYCGRDSVKSVERALREALSGMPRGDLDDSIGTDVRMNAVEDTARRVEERMNVTQGKLVMGFRLGECMEEPNLPAIQVFNTVFGGGTSSKLFRNVREKLSLCYYASSAALVHKGLLLVASGVDAENFGRAEEEILAQLEAIRNGEITDEELEAARRSVASGLRTLCDNPNDLESFWLSQAIDGLDNSPAELAELAGEVTAEDVAAIARSVEYDLCYTLCGGADEEEDDDEN